MGEVKTPCLSRTTTSTMKVVLTVLAVVLAAANTATAAELLEPLYPAKIEEGGDEARARLDLDLARARSIDVEYRAAETEYRAEFRADHLRGSIEMTEGGDEFRAARSASLFDEDGAEARRADFRARMDGDTEENLFGVPLPP